MQQSRGKKVNTLKPKSSRAPTEGNRFGIVFSYRERRRENDK